MKTCIFATGPARMATEPVCKHINLLNKFLLSELRQLRRSAWLLVLQQLPLIYNPSFLDGIVHRLDTTVMMEVYSMQAYA